MFMDQIHMSQWQDTGLCNANQVRVEMYKGGETPGYKKTEDGVKDPNVQILLIYQEKIQKKKKGAQSVDQQLLFKAFGRSNHTPCPVKNQNGWKPRSSSESVLLFFPIWKVTATLARCQNKVSKKLGRYKV